MSGAWLIRMIKPMRKESGNPEIQSPNYSKTHFKRTVHGMLGSNVTSTTTSSSQPMGFLNLLWNSGEILLQWRGIKVFRVRWQTLGRKSVCLSMSRKMGKVVSSCYRWLGHANVQVKMKWFGGTHRKK